LMVSVFVSQIRAMDDDIDIDDVEPVMTDTVALLGDSAKKSQRLEEKKQVKNPAKKPQQLEEKQQLQEANAFQQQILNMQGPDGYTALHVIIMHPDEMDILCPSAAAKISTAQRDLLLLYDTARAKLAAQRIKLGAKVDIKDKDGRTACDIAEKNKDTLPFIHEVIMAGKAVDDWKKLGGNQFTGKNYEIYLAASKTLVTHARDKDTDDYQE